MSEPSAHSNSTKPRSRIRRLLTGLTISGVTLLVMFVVLEIGVRLFVPAEVFSPFQPIYRADPDVGYTLRPNLDGHAFNQPLRTNSLGFRGREWLKERSAGVFRVALIGDSHAFAFGVPFESGVGEALADRLGQRLGRECELLNFGLPGYNAEQQLEVLRHKALSFDPDLVVVLICENDHNKARWCDDEGWLHIPDAPEDAARGPTRPLVTEKSVLRHSRLAMYLKLMWLRATVSSEREEAAKPDEGWMAPVDSAEVAPRVRSVYDSIVGMAELCRAREIPVGVTTLAALPDYRRLLRAFRESTGVPTFELLGLYSDVSGWSELAAKHGLGWDDHLDAASHARWADAIVGWLAESDLLPD